MPCRASPAFVSIATGVSSDRLYLCLRYFGDLGTFYHPQSLANMSNSWLPWVG